MNDHVYRIIEVVGSSKNSIQDAIEIGITRARKNLRNVDWFEVEETRGGLDGDTIYYQVVLKVGFRLED
jgi:flavin-binding protein dodecin